jgi:MerT mercuric transport protein
MQTATKQLWVSVLAAVVGSLCCVAPLVLLTLGISGAWISRLTALEPYRPIFIGVMLSCISFPLDAPPVRLARIRGYNGGSDKFFGSLSSDSRRSLRSRGTPRY